VRLPQRGSGAELVDKDGIVHFFISWRNRFAPVKDSEETRRSTQAQIVALRGEETGAPL
jgi:hypothetical protein